MTRLAIVRHGDYSDQSLNETGRMQIIDIAEKLGKLLEVDEQVLILSSTAIRALESARIISKFLEAPVEEHGLLWSEGAGTVDLPAAYELVQSAKNRCGLLVIVTHLEYARSFPDFVAQKDFGRRFRFQEVNKGEGVILDYTRQHIVRI